jgi:acetylglutamate kinase
MSLMPVTVVKVGGHVINNDKTLKRVLDDFSHISGLKILIHGGGEVVNQIASRMGVPQTLIEGRRVTDSESLKIATMVYAGLINKRIVAGLQARNVMALGLTGADADLIRSKKRSSGSIDFGFVGEIETVQTVRLVQWLNEGLTLVIASITHDGQGQLLNTNADTIANAVASSLSKYKVQPSGFELSVTLVYLFEKKGVLLDLKDEDSLIAEIDCKYFKQLKRDKKISNGMIPKLENAFQAAINGVGRVVVGNANELPNILLGQTGTQVKL